MNDEKPQTTRARAMGRHRRANVVGGRPKSRKVKVTDAENAELERRAAAQEVTVARLLLESALAVAPGETATQRRETLTELFHAYRLLAAVSNNLNQIAKATNATGEVHEDLQMTTAQVRGVGRRVADLIEELRLG